jgi:hypothetical protein
MIRHPDSQLFGEKPSVEVGIIRDKDEARAWLDKAACRTSGVSRRNLSLIVFRSGL